MAEFGTDREMRIALLRMLRQTSRTRPLTLQRMEGITTREIVKRGLLSEFLQHGWIVKTRTPEHLQRAEYQFTPAAEYALDLFEPRTGRYE